MVITLCGSARFEPWFHMWNEALSLAGHCVFGLTGYPASWYTETEKGVLDSVHLDKIDKSDAIIVLNVFAYVSESTMCEIIHARSRGKRVAFLESWGIGLGITEHHSDETKATRDRYGVPIGFGSPISTVVSDENLSPWETDWLGSHGEFRSNIVTRLHCRGARAMRGDRL